MSNDSKPSLDSQPDLFELPANITYLNTANMAPRLRSVTAAGIDAIRWTGTPWEISAADWFSGPEELREIAAALFGITSEGLAFVPSASYGIALAAINVPVERGESIIVLDEQFPSNIYAWQHLAERQKAKIRTVQRGNDGTWTRSVLAAIDENTAVVAVPNCHWTDGSLIDLEQVGEKVRAVDAVLVVDASQSLGAYPLDFDTIKPDFLVSVGYKWLLGPYSLGYLYVAPKWRKTGMPFEHSWLSRAGSENFAGLVEYEESFRSGARRFDVGEYPNFILVPMARAALEQLSDWGIESIDAYLRELTGQLARAAENLGCAVLPDNERVNHMIGLRIPDGISTELTEQLHDERVIVSIRGDSIRVAPHVHTTRSDITRLIEVLRTVLG